MTTVLLSGGDLGSETVAVKCNLTNASSVVYADYGDGGGFVPTQYQAADARHSTAGLTTIAKSLGARACEMAEADFACECVEGLQDSFDAGYELGYLAGNPGSRKTPLKAAAARDNGAKGGRPKVKPLPPGDAHTNA